MAFYDGAYHILKILLKFTRSTYTAKILVMNLANFLLCITFTIVGLKKDKSHNYVKIFKFLIPGCHLLP